MNKSTFLCLGFLRETARQAIVAGCKVGFRGEQSGLYGHPWDWYVLVQVTVELDRKREAFYFNPWVGSKKPDASSH